MGSLSILFGEQDIGSTLASQRAYAECAPHLGAAEYFQHGAFCLAVQSRHDDVVTCETDTAIVAAQGYPHRLGAPGDVGTRLTPEGLLRDYRQQGIECFSGCGGEYAIALYDKRSQTLWLATSLSMTRPLFWQATGPVCAIATELRQVAGLLDRPLRLRPEAVVDTLCFNGPTHDFSRTAFSGVQRLLPPSVFKLTRSQTTPVAEADYWQPSPIDHSLSAQEAIEEGRAIVAAAIDRASQSPRTAVSVSGGLDSTLIWAHLHKHKDAAPSLADYQAYSVTYPGLACDETTRIQQLMSHLHTRSTIMDGTRHAESDFISDQLGRVDGVTAMPTAYQLDVVSRALNEDANHLHLTGIGAERAFHVSRLMCADQLRSGHLIAAWRTCQQWKTYGVAARRPGLKRFITECALPPGSPARHWIARIRNRPSPPPMLAKAWQPYWSNSLHQIHNHYRAEGYHRGSQRYGDHQYALGTGLETIQQHTESYGIEIRAPYLDQSIIDFSYRVPAAILNLGFWQKGLLRAIAAPYLPDELTWQNDKAEYSQVFERDWPLFERTGPITEWFLCREGIVDVDVVGRLEREAHSDRRLSQHLARLAMLEAFASRYHLALDDD